MVFLTMKVGLAGGSPEVAVGDPCVVRAGEAPGVAGSEPDMHESAASAKVIAKIARRHQAAAEKPFGLMTQPFPDILDRLNLDGVGSLNACFAREEESIPAAEIPLSSRNDIGVSANQRELRLVEALRRTRSGPRQVPGRGRSPRHLRCSPGRS
jgi:hypothetical protein